MPRKAQSDEQNEKAKKPKEQFKLVVSIFDDGNVDYDLIEYFTNEATGKRKRLMYDSPSKYRKSIEENLAGNTYKLAAWVLEGLGINLNEVVRNIADSTVYDAPVDSEDEEETEEEA